MTLVDAWEEGESLNNSQTATDRTTIVLRVLAHQGTGRDGLIELSVNVFMDEIDGSDVNRRVGKERESN